jgi:hypothetical protein
MELEPDQIGAERLARTRDIDSRAVEIHGVRADGESLDKRAVARSTSILVPLIVQLGVSVVYSLLFVGLVAFIATEIT